MDKILAFFNGKKTYITAILLGIANIGASLGWWTWDQTKIVDSILAPFGLAFLRMGVDKSGATSPK